MSQTYRTRTTGDRGIREGDRIRLDRPSEPDAWREFNEGAWEEELRHRALTPMQTAMITYVADQALRVSLGLGKGKDWISLSDKQRMFWKQHGPGEEGDLLRKYLYLGILHALEEQHDNE